MLASFAKRNPGQALTIDTPHGHIQTLGATFTVAFAANGIRVQLFSGTISVGASTEKETTSDPNAPVIATKTKLLIESGRIARREPLRETDVAQALRIAKPLAKLPGTPVPMLRNQ